MKQTILTERAPKPIGPYNQAVKTGTLVFLAGQLGLDLETGKLGEGIKEQTRLAFRNAKNILETAGFSLDEVIKVTCLLASMDDFKAMNEEYATVFAADYPARTAYEVSRLPMDALIEIEIIASK